MFLLFRGALPTAPQRAWVQDALGDAREAAFERMDELGDALALPDAMDALRASVAHLTAVPGDEPLTEAARIVGAIAVFATAWGRGTSRVPPNARLPHAADYLRMATRAVAEPRGREALDAYLVTVAEHGMNASTFTARVVASTARGRRGRGGGGDRRPPGARCTAAPRAPCSTCSTRSPPRRSVDGWLAARLAAGERLMGFGHRIYRVRDPRADVLAAQLATLGEAGLARPIAGARPDWRSPRAPGLRPRGRGPRAGGPAPRAPARHQRRVLHRRAARGRRHPAHAIHAGLRDGRGRQGGPRTRRSSVGSGGSSARGLGTRVAAMRRMTRLLQIVCGPLTPSSAASTAERGTDPTRPATP